MKCEQEFKKLDCQTDYVKKVEPLKYSCMLILGVICIFLSLSWLLIIGLQIFQDLMYTLAKRNAEQKIANGSTETEGQSPTEAMNDLTKNIKENLEKFTIDALIKLMMDDGSYNNANILFVCMGLYLTACCFKGN